MQIAGTIVLVLFAVIAAWLDVVARRLPNALCLAVALAGLGFGFAAAGAVPTASAAAHSVIALLVGMLLFRFGMIGGGDAKFYAGCAAWFALPQGLALLGLVSVSGLVLVVVWFTWRRMSPKDRSGETRAFAMVPYGVAVAVGAVAARVLLA